MPPVLELLRDHGIRLGIVTNAYQPMTMRDQELIDLGLRDYFPTCRFSAADVGYLKPHPNIFKTALVCLGLQAEDVVFIGDDAEADIAGAQSVGMKAILRRLSHRPEATNGLNTPDAIIDSFAELPAIFDVWYPDWRRMGAPR